MIPCNMGFVVSYCVLFKSFAPFAFDLVGVKLPSWCDLSFAGQIFWAVLFTVSLNMRWLNLCHLLLDDHLLRLLGAQAFSLEIRQCFLSCAQRLFSTGHHY